MNIQVIRATEIWQQAGAYYVRIQGMAKQHGITLRREFDDKDTPETKYIVLTNDEFPVATCRFYETGPGRSVLGRVVVLPEYRCRGLGRMVVEEAERWLRELGFREVAIDSRIEAVPFYRKLGYAPVDDAVFKSGAFDCIRMRKQI